MDFVRCCKCSYLKNVYKNFTYLWLLINSIWKVHPNKKTESAIHYKVSRLNDMSANSNIVSEDIIIICEKYHLFKNKFIFICIILTPSRGMMAWHYGVRISLQEFYASVQRSPNTSWSTVASQVTRCSKLKCRTRYIPAF